MGRGDRLNGLVTFWLMEASFVIVIEVESATTLHKRNVRAVWLLIGARIDGC